MKQTLKMLMTTAAALSFQPAIAASDAAKALPLTPADEIASEIQRSGRAAALVAFYRGTPRLTAASQRQLVELVKLLEADPDLHIRIGFQADERELGEGAAELASLRAQALRDALLTLDAPGRRVAITGG